MLATQSRQLTLSFPGVDHDPSANVYYEIDLAHSVPGFAKSGVDGVEVPLFADLKLHDMGPALTEETGNSLFTKDALPKPR